MLYFYVTRPKVLCVCRSYTYVCANWAIAIAITTAMRRYADGAVTYDDDTSLRATCAAGGCDSDASLRGRTNDYATAMRRYVRVKCSISATRTERLRQRCIAIYTKRYISTYFTHAPKCCVCVVRILMCARTGRLQLRQGCVATRTKRLLTTAIRRYALRTHKIQTVLFVYFYFTRPKAPLGGMGRRARWHSLRTAGKTIHDKRAEALIIIEI